MIAEHVTAGDIKVVERRLRAIETMAGQCVRLAMRSRSGNPVPHQRRSLVELDNVLHSMEFEIRAINSQLGR